MQLPHTPMSSFPLCQLCQEHVPLEVCTTDDRGQAVHEECYASHLTSQNPARNPCVGALGT
jgi:hypothetical protein